MVRLSSPATGAADFRGVGTPKRIHLSADELGREHHRRSNADNRSRLTDWQPRRAAHVCGYVLKETTMLSRLITGDGMRKTRLHNYSGHFLDLTGFLYLPRSILTAISLKLTNHRPEIPWLGFRAIKHLDKIIAHDWKVLEFGSGMSTIWLARRCELLVSIETNNSWYRDVTSMLKERSLNNIDYKLCDESVADALEDYDDSFFDLVLVDGYNRDRAMMTAISKVKLGGYIYLDNSDVPYLEHRTAKAMLINAAGGQSYIKVFNDLYPTQISVNEGILASIHNKTYLTNNELQKHVMQPKQFIALDLTNTRSNGHKRA